MQTITDLSRAKVMEMDEKILDTALCNWMVLPLSFWSWPDMLRVTPPLPNGTPLLYHLRMTPDAPGMVIFTGTGVLASLTLWVSLRPAFWPCSASSCRSWAHVQQAPSVVQSRARWKPRSPKPKRVGCVVFGVLLSQSLGWVTMAGYNFTMPDIDVWTSSLNFEVEEVNRPLLLAPQRYGQGIFIESADSTSRGSSAEIRCPLSRSRRDSTRRLLGRLAGGTWSRCKI